MAQYSRVGFKSSVEVNEVNLSLSYGGVGHGHGIGSNLAGILEQTLTLSLVCQNKTMQKKTKTYQN